MELKFSIIVPAYNEEKRIKKVLEKLMAGFEDYEIIVVDDGSKDMTGEIAKSLGVIVVRHERNIGKGGAIRTGFLHAKGSIVGFVDADESIAALDIKKVFESGVGDRIAIASRCHVNSKIPIKQPLVRRFASRGFNILVRLLFGLSINDTQCGCKAMESEIARELAREATSKGFEFDAEILWLASKKGYKIEEVPITWRHEEGSTFSLKYAMPMFVNLLKIRFGRRNHK